MEPKQGKTATIYRWKKRGIIHDDFDNLYELYVNTLNCNHCHVKFNNTRDRCLDHCHIDGYVRQILCTSCNVMEIRRDPRLKYKNYKSVLNGTNTIHDLWIKYDKPLGG